MTVAGLRRYGDWRHVTTGCTALVALMTTGDAAARVATGSRRPRLHVSLLRLFHRLRLVLHAQPVHRRHHRQLQHAEEKGLIDNRALFCFCQQPALMQHATS